MAKRLRAIAFVAQKGGTGQTTLAAMLAVAAAQSGENVLAIDVDPQGSLSAWGHRRNGKGSTGERLYVDRLAADQARHLPALLDALAAKGFTITILDTAGVDDAATHRVMAAVDLCLMPARPTRVDVEASRRTFRTAITLGKPTAFLLNQCPPMVQSARAIEAAKGLKMLDVLADPLVTSRPDFQDAVAAGLGVTEYAPTGKAAIETAALWRWVHTRLAKGSNNGKASPFNSPKPAA
jgi:chromosome partitioning protein